MPNQSVPKSTFSHRETVDTNLRLIDSLAWLMVAATPNSDSQTISDTMQVISRLAKEASDANKETWKATQGGKL